MLQCLAGALAAMLTVLNAACGSGDGSGPGEEPAAGARLQEIASGLNMPLFVTAPAGDQARVFVVEKAGRIRIVQNNALVGTPFLDITAKVSTGGEQGLLGLAFHPQYASNGKFVINYTDVSGDTRVSVYTVSADPMRADAQSEQIILTVDQPFSNHNGGMVVFGPDGKLYIGLGDGGSAGDPQNNGQNRNSLLGKILRLDVNGAGGASVPADNPFVGQTDARPEVWSYGLRNPWRFSFDRTTGDLYIGDVGQGGHEEIDVSTAASGRGRGVNYGWRIMEGSFCYNASSCVRAGLTEPVLDYTHADGCSVTGGYVYRGSAVPALTGLYLYADYCSGWVRSFRLSGGAATEQKDWASLRPGGQILSFGEDPRGELYVMTAAGKVFRIEPAP